MTLTQYQRAMVAFRAEMDADNADRFRQWETARKANAAGFAARARAARAERDATANRVRFAERFADIHA